jgi:hypothetical protein
LAGLVLSGCRDQTPPPPRAEMPPVGTYTNVRGGAPKPLPGQGDPRLPPPPFDDVPLVNQETPEQARFVQTYAAVGSPRVSLFVNRTFEGKIVPTTEDRLVEGRVVTRESTGGVKTETRRGRLDRYGREVDENVDKFESTGPAKIVDRDEKYLAAGEYDDVAARRIDYDAIENVMTDWIAAGGRVTMVSPRLTEAQRRKLEAGEGNALRDLGKENTDVLIQVQAKPTRQTSAGLEVRLIAEAINTNGGESLGRAFVDVPPPLDKPVLNDSTRFLARKLMADMTATWQAPRPPQREGAAPNEPPKEPRIETQDGQQNQPGNGAQAEPPAKPQPQLPPPPVELDAQSLPQPPATQPQ